MPTKKRILVIAEATYLNTGYANYGKELLKRLHNTGKYEVAEFSIYGSVDDPRRKNIPWKNYPNLPTNEEESKFYNSNPIHQFGAWKFDRICLEFKPDLVITFRDFWMDSFIQQSPFRRFFKLALMPTCDSPAQSEEWISFFSKADYLFTYSDFAKKTLEDEGGLKVRGVATPLAHGEFTPDFNKRQYKESVGINPDWKIIGTVMRNQRRKLFPDLFDAFSRFLKKTQDINTYLYCHTSYPDNGWNLAKYLIKYGISSRVLFTYVCDCGFIQACKFGDTVQQCPQCHNFSFRTANVSQGLSSEQLASVYRLFDLYVQPISAEGGGIPCMEAASCGIPLLVTDHSCTQDYIKKLKAWPIKCASNLFNELETGCLRAVLDIQDLSDKFEKFFSLPEPVRLQMGIETHNLYHKHYSWDNVMQHWIDAADDCPYADYSTPPIINNIPEKAPQFVNNKQFVDWLSSFINDPTFHNGYDYHLLLKDLNFGMFRNGAGGYFYSDNSAFGRENYRPFNQQIALEMVKGRVEKDNFWERARVGMIQLPKEKWLE